MIKKRQLVMSDSRVYTPPDGWTIIDFKVSNVHSSMSGTGTYNEKNYMESSRVFILIEEIGEK